MTCCRSEEIKVHLHFNNNATRGENCNTLLKIRPILNHLQRKVQAEKLAENLCVDEQVISFKRKSSIKQYDPKKPTKWGYKVFVLTSASGIIHNFEVYTGRIKATPQQPDIGASGNIVLRLVQHVQRDVWHKMHIDNWFNSPKLQIALWNLGIACLGTVRSSRLKDCAMKLNSLMKKAGRGAIATMLTCENGVELNAIKWMDSEAVHMLLTFVGSHLTQEVPRFDQKTKSDIAVLQPSTVRLYNRLIGGVNLLDSLIALYRNTLRTKKWYYRVFHHVLDMMAVQSWHCYRQSTQNSTSSSEGSSLPLPLLRFKLKIAHRLIMENKACGQRRGRPSLEVETQLQIKRIRGPMTLVPPLPVRTDDIGHYPLPILKKGRYRLPHCTGYSRIQCKQYAECISA